MADCSSVLLTSSKTLTSVDASLMWRYSGEKATSRRTLTVSPSLDVELLRGLMNELDELVELRSLRIIDPRTVTERYAVDGG